MPWGFRRILNWVWKRYRTPIYITENGIPCSTEAEQQLPQVLNDQHRIAYHHGYLESMREAVVEDGVDVRSYFAWSLTDNWEWADGFRTRFGVTYTERDEEGKVIRYWPKKSAGALTSWFSHNVSS